MRKILPLLLLLPVIASAQTGCNCKYWQVFASVSQNPASLGNPFQGPFHPGVTAGANVRLNQNTKHQVFESFKVGYLYHPYIQHAIQAYTEFGYKYKADAGYAIAPVIGGGYVHSIPTEKVMRLQDDGTYKVVTRWGRPNWLISLGLNAGYDLSKAIKKPISVYVSYRLQVQGTFIHKTSPFLPYSSIGLGVATPLATFCKSDEK